MAINFYDALLQRGPRWRRVAARGREVDTQAGLALWGLIAGIVGIAAAGGVYGVMSGRVTDLESQIEANASQFTEAQRIQEEARAELQKEAEAEQARAKQAEDELSAQVERGRQRYDEVSEDLRRATIRGNGLRAQIASVEASLEKAKAAGDETSNLVRAQEEELTSLKASLAKSEEAQENAKENLETTREELEGLENQFAEAAKKHAELAAENQLAHARDMTSLRTALAVQEKTVTDLEKKLKTAQGAQVASLQRQLGRATRRLGDLEKKVKAGNSKTALISGAAGGILGGALSGVISGLFGKKGGGTRLGGSSGSSSGSGGATTTPLATQRFQTLVVTPTTGPEAMRLDTATGKTWTSSLGGGTSGAPIEVAAKDATGAQAPAVDTIAGRYELHATTSPSGLVNVVRLDTRTGRAWKFLPGAVWQLVPNPRASLSPLPVKTWVLTTSTATTPRVSLTNTSNGKVDADFFGPPLTQFLPIN